MIDLDFFYVRTYSMGLAEILKNELLEPKNKLELKTALKILTADIVSKNSECKILVFGSIAKGLATNSSDIDLAVILPDHVDKKTVRLDFFENRTKIKIPLDIIFRNHSEHIRNLNDNPIDQEISQNGIEIYPCWMLND